MPRINPRTATLLLLVGLGVAVGVWGLQRAQLDRTARATADLADQMIAAGNTDEAVRLLNRFVVMRPDDAARHTQLARLRADRALAGKSPRAEISRTKEMLIIAVARDPDDDDLREKLALFLLDSDEKELARDHLNVLRERVATGNDPAAVGRIGLLAAQTALATEKLPEAESILTSLVTVAPGQAFPAGRGEAFVLLSAIAANARRQPLAAEALLVRMTEAYPDDPRAWTLLAARYSANGKPGEAATAVERARAIAPDDPEAALLDARIALTRQDYDRAERILDGPLREAPVSESLVAVRDRVAAVRGNTERRLEVLREGAAAFPANPAIRIALLDALTDAGRVDELRQLAEEAAQASGPDTLVARYAAASLALAEGRWLAALESWSRLRDELANSPLGVRRTDLAIATCHDALGQPDQAAVIRQRLAGDDPGSPMSRLIEASRLEENGKNSDALAAVESLVGDLPPDAVFTMPAIWTKLMRLRILEQTARPEEARDWSKVDDLLEAVGRAPSISGAGRERLRVDVLAAKGDLDGAISAAEAAVVADPDDGMLLAQLIRLLAASSRGEEAAARIAAAPAGIRDSAELIDAEITVATANGAVDSKRLLADIERRAASLPGDVGARVLGRLFTVFAASGDTKTAERIGDSLLASSPDDIGIRQKLLDLAAERGATAKVDEHADAIVERMGADSPDGRLALGVRSLAAIRARILDQTDRGPIIESLDENDQKALAAVRSSLAAVAQERPGWPEVHLALASADTLRGDPAAAIAHLQRAAALETIPIARRRLATALVRSGRFSEAIQVIVALGKSGGPSIDQIRAELLASIGRKEEARSIAAALTPDDCRDAAQLAWYATFLERNGSPGETEAACRRAIAIDPSLLLPRTTLLRIQAGQGRAEEAAATRRDALTALEGNDRFQFDEASAIALGEQDEFVKSLRATVESSPDDLVAARRLVEFLLRQGRVGEARGELLRMTRLETARGTPTLTWARRRLAEQIATQPGQASLQQSLDLLAENVEADGSQRPLDTALAARILLSRSDPASWRRGLGMMQQLDRLQPISVADKLLCASVEARLGPRQRAKVREQLSAIIAAGEGGQDVMTSLAGMCLEDGDTEAGAEWIETLRRLAPDALPTLRLQARLAVARGDRDAARQVITRLLTDERIAAGDSDRGLDAAAFAAELDFTAEADQLLVALEEKSPQAVLARARSLAKRQMAAEATALVETVRGKVPPMQILQTLIEILLTTRDEAAVETIIGLAEGIFREEGNSPDISLHEGIIRSVAGQTERARTIFSDLIESGSVQGTKKALVQANLAFLIAKPSTADVAGKLIDEAIDELGPQPDLLDTRAVIRHASGQTSLALQDMADVVVKPTAQHYLHLASIRADAGDLDGAGTAYERSLELGLEDARLLPDDLLRKLRLEAALGGR